MKHFFNFTLPFKILLFTGLTLLIVLAISFSTITIRENQQMLADYVLLAKSVACTAGKSMNHSMVTGDMDGIQKICAEVGKLETIDNIRVLNSKLTIKRSSNLKEIETSAQGKDLDRVIATGQQEGWIQDYYGRRVYREVIPYANGPQCRGCHNDVEEGGILGALDVSVCLESMYVLQTSNQRKMMTHLLLVGLVVCLIIFISVKLIISRPIKNLTDMVIDIAQGEGDLTKRIVLDSQDELGGLARNFNLFLDKLHDIIGNVTQFSNKIAETSKELASSAEEMVSASDSQRSQTDQVATAMEEMSSTVADVARNSGRASEFTKKAVETAKKGGEIVHKTMKEMENINQIVNEASSTITKLGQNSDQIGEIIGVIDEIADQTNLLALNAAIEAARAGEQGRGFAVVADEIRKLAERTTKSTKEIAVMIKTIQSDTQGAVASMDIGTNEVKEGVKFSKEAKDALNEIVDIVEQVTQMVNQIAIAAEQQSTATDEISSSVEAVATVSSQNAKGAHQSSSACENLAHLASELQQMVGRFKLKKYF